MIPEKPKRKRNARKRNTTRRIGIMVFSALAISLPTTLLWTTRRGEQLADMVAMSIILCCLIVIVYQVVLSILQALLAPAEPEETTITIDLSDDMS